MPDLYFREVLQYSEFMYLYSLAYRAPPAPARRLRPRARAARPRGTLLSRPWDTLKMKDENEVWNAPPSVSNRARGALTN